MRRVPLGRHNASSYVSGRVMSDQTEHSRVIIVGYVPSGHYFLVTISGHYFPSGATLGTYDGRQIISMCVVRIVSSST
jgi:hypothetical protein